MQFLRPLGLIAIVLGIAMGSVALGDGPSADRTEVRPLSPSRQTAPTYKVQAGIDGEIYPVFANFASFQALGQRTFGMIAVTVSNPTQNALRERVAVSLPGWSDEEIQVAEVAPGATSTLLFAPPFLPRFYSNREIIAASAHVAVTQLAGTPEYETTIPVRLRSAEDIYWGNNFKYAAFIASWVTPHDTLIERLLAEAKQYTPDKRLPGYETWKTWAQQEQETYIQAKAIFNAVKAAGLSYVKSSLSLGDHQTMSERVRMPNLSLARSSANCIDAAVLYASLFENLAMEPSVVIVPGHAYVAVKVAQGSDKLLYIDVALTGRMTFEQAVASAQAGMDRQDPAAVTQINISDARSVGIYPMP